MSRYQNLYSNGVSLSAAQNIANTAQDVKVLASSQNYTATTQNFPAREIVYKNGIYTDQASTTRTYATESAIVISNIQISE